MSLMALDVQLYNTLDADLSELSNMLFHFPKERSHNTAYATIPNGLKLTPFFGESCNSRVASICFHVS